MNAVLKGFTLCVYLSECEQQVLLLLETHLFTKGIFHLIYDI